MKIEFDPAKDAANRLKRGLSLSLGADVVRSAVNTVMDRRFDYGEERFVAFGYVAGRLHVCVFTVRGDATRIISVRKANENEVARYG
jgi:uncharacterized DUF497 family protein